MTRRSNRHIHGRPRRGSGQALVPVLMVVLILTALAVTLSLASRHETVAASAYMREAQAQCLAQGAVSYAAAELQQATNGGTTTPELSPPPDTDANGWTQAGDGWFKLEIVDTTSRININTADAATLAKLPALQADPSLAAAIVDWRDADDNASVVSGGSGTESDYYQSLPVPYAAKNAPFDTIDELLLVRGFSTKLLYGANPAASGGTQTSLTGAGATLAARSRQAAGGQGGTSEQPAVDTSTSTTPLAELITTYSRESNVASDGTQRVNIKTASQSVLQNQLGLSAQLAQRLISARGTNGDSFTSVADLLNVPGFTRQMMQQIGDKVTVSDGQYRDGVVNINTAPAEVLATIPGVDETVYNAVVQAREAGTTFSGLNDLFQLTSLNRQQLQRLLAAVCTKSSVYLVRVKVRMQGSARVYAAEALVELAAPAQQTGGTAGGTGTGGGTGATAPAEATGTARILQWREVPRYPGWSTWLAPPSYYNPTGGSVGTP